MATHTRTKAQPNAALDTDIVAPPANGTVALTPTSNLPTNLAPESAAILSIIERASRDPAVDIDKMERLFRMKLDMEARAAKAAYLTALAEMQPKLPVITKHGVIGMNKKDDGGRKTGEQVAMTKYAKWEDVMEGITPLLAEYGFSLSFRIAQPTPDRIAVSGVLGHREGHTEETTISLPIDSTGAKNNVQGWGSSTSYGKRYTGFALLNITARGEDDDGDAAGYRPSAGSAGAGPDFRGHSSAHGRELAADDPHLVSDRKKNEPAPPPAFEPPTDAVQWTNNTISTLNTSAMTEPQIKEFAAKHGPTIGWIKANVAEQYARISTAYGNALEAARTKAAKPAPPAEPKPTVTDAADLNEPPPEHARPGHPLQFTPFDKNSDFMNFAEDFLPKTNPPGAQQFLAYYEAKLKRMEATDNADVKEAAAWVRATAAEIINPPDSAKA